MFDKYTQEYIDLIHKATTDEELAEIIDNIYEDGWHDGCDDDTIF